MVQIRIILGSIIDRVRSGTSRRAGTRARGATGVAVACAAGAAAILALTWSAAVGAESGTYRSPEAFVEQAFPTGAPQARAVWLRAELRDHVAAILGRTPAPRVRYWQQDGKTAWILEEIGKDKPITAGVVIRDGAIEDIQVLVFRESRGWEVKYPFFTRQFQDARLTSGRDLDQAIDGITGATLSVRAMTKMARVALLLDAHTRGRVSNLATAR